MTLIASATNTPPIISSSNSCRAITAINPSVPPHPTDEDRSLDDVARDLLGHLFR
jgi:glyceraldehyde-3-phosphate dehydrogenase/erythrose-4-phosphate dehydrogenase